MVTIPINYAAVIHSLKYTGDNEAMAITYGVGIDTATPPVDAAAAAGELGQFFATRLLPLLPPAVQLTSTEVKWQTVAPPADPVIGASTLGAAGGGNGGVNLLPQNCAWLIHKRTAFAGRRGRGRLYLPGPAEGEVDNLGQVGIATQNSWNGALSSWRTDISGSASFLGMCILHGPGVSAVPAPYFVSSLSLDPVIATQRRRLRR